MISILTAHGKVNYKEENISCQRKLYKLRKQTFWLTGYILKVVIIAKFSKSTGSSNVLLSVNCVNRKLKVKIHS